MSEPGVGEAAQEAARAGVTRTVEDFAAALRLHLPKRLGQLRQLGRETRSLSRGKPRR